MKTPSGSATHAAVLFIIATYSPGLSPETAFSQESTVPAPAAESDSIRISEGPWGKIESYPVTLEPPDTHLWAALYDQRSYWSFGGMRQEEVLELLASLGFRDETMRLISSEATWKNGPLGLEVEITDAIVESLTPENRAALSKWLRLNQFNVFTKLVVNLEGGDLSAFDRGAVSPRTIELVKRFIFPRRNVLSLIDRPYILRHIEEEEEKTRFLRALFSTKSLIVRLVIDDSTDLEAVADYWTAGGLNPGIESVLQSVRNTTGVRRLDLVQILPPLPRRYLYGFTNMGDITPMNTPDCFWASVQFFRHQASGRLLDPLHYEHHLDGVFEKVEGEPRFGDLVCMFDVSDGAFQHGYVHIADDIVFSKNGASFARPFVLTRKSDMLSVYLDESGYRFEVYRPIRAHE